MKNLFVYGTLKRGEKNSYLLDKIGGEWIEATVKGHLHEEGWGSKFGCPGIRVDLNGQVVQGYIFRSDKLEENISFFDEFEGGEYKRTITDVTLKNGITTKAYIYQLI
jgi:gamma-glutamylcyclotransferase (GGCT)/AIG2-like uncharacterized protein YtfP